MSRSPLRPTCVCCPAKRLVAMARSKYLSKSKARERAAKSHIRADRSFCPIACRPHRSHRTRRRPVRDLRECEVRIGARVTEADQVLAQSPTEAFRRGRVVTPIGDSTQLTRIGCRLS